MLANCDAAAKVSPTPIKTGSVLSIVHCSCAQVRECAPPDRLARARHARGHHDRRRLIQTMLGQLHGNLRRGPPPHVEDEGRRGIGEAAPVQIVG